MAEFKVVIAGVCCHYRGNPARIRTVLVEAGAHQYPHFAYIEVQKGGVLDSAGLVRMQIGGLDSYDREGVTYEAYRLQGHHLSIPSSDSEIEVQGDFEYGVPHLPDVCSAFGGTRIVDFIVDDPSGPVAAQLDITGGELSVLESSEPTHFEPVVNDPPNQPGLDRPLATHVQLKLNVGTTPYITVKRFDGGPTRTFRLQSWVTRIGIGNMGENGMLGIEELDARHFLINYAMANASPGCNALPVEINTTVGKGLGGGCANTQYP